MLSALEKLLKQNGDPEVEATGVLGMTGNWLTGRSGDLVLSGGTPAEELALAEEAGSSPVSL